MPTYLFECECGKVTEKQIRLDEGIAHTCECGKEARRVFTVIAAHFKGTGWGKD
jgi:putative FmdB family regulatory protein